MRAHMRAGVLVAILGTLAAACGGTASPSSAPPATSAAAVTSTAAPSTTAPLVKVNIRFSFHVNGQYAPFFLGVEKGFYTDEGLDVTLQEGTGGTQVVQTVAAGQDFMVTPGLDIVVSAVAQGAPVKAVATNLTIAIARLAAMAAKITLLDSAAILIHPRSIKAKPLFCIELSA